MPDLTLRHKIGYSAIAFAVFQFAAFIGILVIAGLCNKLKKRLRTKFLKRAMQAATDAREATKKITMYAASTFD